MALRSIQTEETALKELSELQQQEAQKAAERERAAKEAARKKKRQRQRKASAAKTRSSEASADGGIALDTGQDTSQSTPKPADGKTRQHPPRRRSKDEQSHQPPSTDQVATQGKGERPKDGRQRQRPPRRRSKDGQAPQNSEPPNQAADQGSEDKLNRTPRQRRRPPHAPGRIDSPVGPASGREQGSASVQPNLAACKQGEQHVNRMNPRAELQA